MRPRHDKIVETLKLMKVKINFISDGDVSGVISVSNSNSGNDIYIGTGGAPEGVLAASALRCIGGQMWGRLTFRNNDERSRADRLGITDYNKIYTLNDIVVPNNEVVNVAPLSAKKIA